MSETKSINKENSSLEFQGSALAGLKSHKGTFNKWEAKVTIENGKTVALEGSIEANSVKTDGGEKLDTHLKSPDFFDAENNPKITFESTKIGDNQMTGQLTFRGETQELTFPVSTSENSISTEFDFDTGKFGFSKFGVKKEVKIKFNFVF